MRNKVLWKLPRNIFTPGQALVWCITAEQIIYKILANQLWHILSPFVSSDKYCKLNDFLYLIQETFPTCQCSTAANADDSLWSAGQTSSHSIITKNMLFQKGILSKLQKNIRKEALKKDFSQTIESERVGCDQSDDQIHAGLNSMIQNKTFLFKFCQFKSSTGLVEMLELEPRSPPDTASLRSEPCKSSTEWDVSLQLLLTALWGNPESQSALLWDSATPGSRCQSVWPGPQS